MKLNCSQCTSFFYEYLNNELDKNTTKDFVSHMDSCPACAEGYQIYRACFSVDTLEDDFQYPENLEAKIKFRLHEVKKEKKHKVSTKMILTYVTSLSFLFVFSVLGIKHYTSMKNIYDDSIKENISTAQPAATEIPTVEDQPAPVVSADIAKVDTQVQPTETPAVTPEAVSGTVIQTAQPSAKPSIQPSESPVNIQLQNAPQADSMPAKETGGTDVQFAGDAAPAVENQSPVVYEQPSPASAVMPPVMPSATATPVLKSNESEPSEEPLAMSIMLSPAPSDVDSEAVYSADEAPVTGSSAPGGAGGGGGSTPSNGVSAPDSVNTYHVCMDKKYQEDVLKAYAYKSIGKDLYQLSVRLVNFQEAFPDAKVVSQTDADTITVKFE